MISKASVLGVLACHVGSQRGIHMDALAIRLCGPRAGEADKRQIRKVIVALRDDGERICGRPDSGYYLAATAEELDATCEFLLHRVQTTVTQIARMKRRSIPNLRGQLGLPDIDPTTITAGDPS